MTSEMHDLTAPGRDAIADCLEHFQEVAGLRRPTVDIQVDSLSEMADAIECSLAAIAEFGQPFHPSSRIDHHLKALIEHIRAFEQANSLKRLLQSISASNQAAWHLVDERLSNRAQKSFVKAKEQLRHLQRDRFGYQIEQLRSMECERREIETRRMAHVSLQTEWNRLLSAFDVDNSSFTLVHDLDECATQFQFKLRFYDRLLGNEQEKPELEPIVTKLKSYSADAVRWSSMSTCCTKLVGKGESGNNGLRFDHARRCVPSSLPRRVC